MALTSAMSKVVRSIQLFVDTDQRAGGLKLKGNSGLKGVERAKVYEGL